MKTFFKRLGLVGFCFFLVKGLLWLLLPVAVAVWTIGSETLP